MFKSLRFIAILVTLGSTVLLIQCGNKTSNSGPIANAPPGLKKTQSLSSARPVQAGECRISDVAEVDTNVSTSGPILWARGGGWEDSQTLQGFAKLAIPGKPVILVLSATTPTNQQGTQYFLDYYQSRMKGTRLVPLYTKANGTGTSNPNSAANAETIRGAGAIVITGGYPANLRHVPGTAVGNAIAEAFHKGTPVYSNSASVALVGGYFTWDVPANLGRSNPGLDLVDFPMLSHLEEPQKFHQGLSDLWNLVPSQFNQAFGMVAGTVAIFQGGRLRVRNTGAPGKVYVYDERFLRTTNCRQWILSPGEELPLR